MGLAQNPHFCVGCHSFKLKWIYENQHNSKVRIYWSYVFNGGTVIKLCVLWTWCSSTKPILTATAPLYQLTATVRDSQTLWKYVRIIYVIAEGSITASISSVFLFYISKYLGIFRNDSWHKTRNSFKHTQWMAVYVGIVATILC